MRSLLVVCSWKLSCASIESVVVISLLNIDLAQGRLGHSAGSFTYAFSAGAGELYYLRMLLLHRVGATSFADVQTVSVNDSPPTLHPTFKAAAMALGVIEDDAERHEAFHQAANHAAAPQIRSFFVDLLRTSEV